MIIVTSVTSTKKHLPPASAFGLTNL